MAGGAYQGDGYSVYAQGTGDGENNWGVESGIAWRMNDNVSAGVSVFVSGNATNGSRAFSDVGGRAQVQVVF